MAVDERTKTELATVTQELEHLRSQERRLDHYIDSLAAQIKHRVRAHGAASGAASGAAAAAQCHAHALRRQTSGQHWDENAFVPHDDLRRLEFFQGGCSAAASPVASCAHRVAAAGNTIIAMRGPPGSTLEVPAPDSADAPGGRVFQMYVRGKDGPVDVYLVSDNVDGGAEEPSLGAAAGSRAAQGAEEEEEEEAEEEEEEEEEDAAAAVTTPSRRRAAASTPVKRGGRGARRSRPASPAAAGMAAASAKSAAAAAPAVPDAASSHARSHTPAPAVLRLSPVAASDGQFAFGLQGDEPIAEMFVGDSPRSAAPQALLPNTSPAVPLRASGRRGGAAEALLPTPAMPSLPTPVMPSLPSSLSSLDRDAFVPGPVFSLDSVLGGGDSQPSDSGFLDPFGVRAGARCRASC